MEEMEEDRPKGTRAASAAAGKKQKGRGFHDRSGDEDRGGDNRRFEALEPAAKGTTPAKSVEGWVIFITGVHEEAQEEDVTEAFAEFGEVKNVYLNLDRQTGFVKGYALVEYASKKEAEEAILQMNGQDLLTQKITVGWAFSAGPINRLGARRGGERWGGQQRQIR